MNTKKHKLIILGAGAGGLGAACWAKYHGIDFCVIEGNKELPLNMHNGVHYLHSVPRIPFGTDLKRITLTDGILADGVIKHKADLIDALNYSEKVREIQHPSSILEVGKEEAAYLPSTNSMNTLLEEMYNYAGATNFSFNSWIQDIDLESKKILVSDGREETLIEYEFLLSTIPLKKLIEISEIGLDGKYEFNSSPIKIVNFKVDRIVPNWLINLYVPSPYYSVYRASVLNNLISIESKEELDEYSEIKNLFHMFHIDFSNPEKYNWVSGKVISISKDAREEVCRKFAEHDVFTIGRFGLWNRKLLVDTTINQAEFVVSNLDLKEEIVKHLS